MESSVKAAELLLPEEEVTDSRVLSPARLMVVDEKVPLVRAIGGEASLCLRVVDGWSWGRLSVSVCIHETASQYTAGGESEACSVLKKPFQFLLLASVATPTGSNAAVVRGSVDTPRASRDPVLISA